MPLLAKNATELCRIAQIKYPGTDYLPLAQDARHFAELLLENHLWMDAIAYLSFAISPRESIWWAWFCARKAALPQSDPVDLKALSIAEAWIAQPNEDNRQAARLQSEHMPASVAQSVLQAIYATGDIENEITGEKSPGSPLLPHKYVQVTVISAVYAINVDNPELAATEFLRQALDVANRIQLWTQYT